jgi:hypothetical protein
MVADCHDARAARSHHSHGSTRTQTHFAQPMDVVRLTIDFQNGARLTRCKVSQRHDLASRSMGNGEALHSQNPNDRDESILRLSLNVQLLA